MADFALRRRGGDLFSSSFEGLPDLEFKRGPILAASSTKKIMSDVKSNNQLPIVLGNSLFRDLSSQLRSFAVVIPDVCKPPFTVQLTEHKIHNGMVTVHTFTLSDVLQRLLMIRICKQERLSILKNRICCTASKSEKDWSSPVFFTFTLL